MSHHLHSTPHSWTSWGCSFSPGHWPGGHWYICWPKSVGRLLFKELIGPYSLLFLFVFPPQSKDPSKLRKLVNSCFCRSTVMSCLYGHMKEQSKRTHRIIIIPSSGTLPFTTQFYPWIKTWNSIITESSKYVWYFGERAEHSLVFTTGYMRLRV